MLDKLKKPVCFIDLETTGLDTENDKIVEITICKVHVDGTREVKTRVVNPERPISPEATALHGFSDADVANEQPFKKYAKALAAFISDSDIAGYNSNSYDLPLLNAEFERAGVEWNYRESNLIDVCNIFKIKEPRTLAGAYQFYCGKELENTHSSKSDILATVEVFEAQIKKYDLPTDPKELAVLSNYDKEMLDLSGKFVKDADGDIVFNFGKHKGVKCIKEVGFLEWMTGPKATFSKETTTIALSLIELAKQEA